MNIPAELEAKIDEAITHYPVSKRSASLPLLHLIQEHFGYIPEEAIPWIAQKLELQPINIYELVTFYPMFRRQPVGKCHIRVCRTLSCAMAGSYELMDTICELTGIHRHSASATPAPPVGIPSDDHPEPPSHDPNAGHGNPISISPDGRFSIEFVECLASCGSAPVCMFNDDFYENISDKAKVEKILQQYSTPL